MYPYDRPTYLTYPTLQRSQVMPEGYKKMRDKFISEGMSENAAKHKAARIWNDKHPSNPVGKGERRSKKKK